MRSLATGVLGEDRAAQLRRACDPARIQARSLLTEHGQASRRRLGRYHNRYSGERAVILGNGPSLARTDLALLRNEVTFGLNRVYLLFPELGFATTFLVAINELVISQTVGELSALACPAFIRWSCRRLFDAHRTDLAFLQSRHSPGFSRDVRQGVWEGATVTYVALQLAFHMGFSQVILVGVDHNFVTQGPPHKVVESTGPDPNHFDPRYFGRGFRWQLPDLPTSEFAYDLAKKTYEADGRAVVDATVGGKLEIFPKCDLAAALKQ